MSKRTIKIEILVESDDLNNSVELCSNHIISSMAYTISNANIKYNKSNNRVTLTSKIETS
jgi:hypothetical protein